MRVAIDFTVIFVYFLSGVLFYTFLTSDAQEYAEQWTVTECLYFGMVTMSTVGYGDFSPVGARGRAFTIVYILVGITQFFRLSNVIVELVFTPLFRKSRALFESIPALMQVPIDIDGNGEADYYVPRSPPIYYGKNLLPSLGDLV